MSPPLMTGTFPQLSHACLSLALVYQYTYRPWLLNFCQCRFFYLTRKHAVRLPNPPQMHNKGNYVISLRCPHVHAHHMPVLHWLIFK